MQNNYDYNIRREVLKHISYRKLGANFSLLSNAPVCAEKTDLAILENQNHKY